MKTDDISKETLCKLKELKTTEEIRDFLSKEGVELSMEQLEAIAGGRLADALNSSLAEEFEKDLDIQALIRELLGGDDAAGNNSLQ